MPRMTIEEVEEPTVDLVEAPARAHAHNRIILNLMIKNESRIIQRCLEAALPHVDAVAILDTGSTDDTVAIATNVLQTAGKPYKITTEPLWHLRTIRPLPNHLRFSRLTHLSIRSSC